MTVAILTPSCVSKKKVLEITTDYETRISLVREELLNAQRQISQLNLQLAERRGENSVLTAMQDKLQAKIESLENELKRTSTRVVDVQQGLSTVIQSKDSLVLIQQALLNTVEETILSHAAELEKFSQVLKDSLQRFPPEQWEVAVQGLEVRLILAEGVLFKPGITSKIEPAGEAILRSVGNMLALYPKYFLSVIGHHDNQPIPRRVVPDAWDYTVLRAATVSRSLVRDFEVSSGRITAAGRGAFAPLTSNETAQGQARNRRVEIVIFEAPEVLSKALLNLLRNP